MNQNIRIIPRENPLILEIKVESDMLRDGVPAISPDSLGELRNIVDKTLLVRHYKLFIIDLKGLEFGGSALVAKLLMCYEKSLSVKCRLVTINLTSEFFKRSELAGIGEIIPCYKEEDSPQPEEYESFFGLNRISLEPLSPIVQEEIEEKEAESEVHKEEEDDATEENEEHLYLYTMNTL